MRAEQWATAELGLLAPELKPACHEATAKAWGHTPITKTDPAMPDLGRASEPRRSRAKGIAVVTGGLLLALCLVAVCVRAPAPALMAASVDPSPARTPFPHPRPYSSHPVAQGASFLRGRKAVSAVRPHKPPGPAPSRGRAGPARSGTGRSPHRHPFIVEAAPWGLVVIAGYALCRYFWSGSTLPGKWAHRGFAGIIANADRECVPGSWGRYRQLILRDGPPAPSGAPTAGNAPGFAFAVLSIASGHKITKRKGVKRLSQLEKLKRKLASVPQFKGVAYDRNAQRDEPPPPSPVPYEWRDELRRRAEVVQALAVPQEQEPENIDDRGFRKRWVHFARPHIGGNTFGKIDWHLKENMYSVIVDMRDARTPASSTHPYLERLAGMASVHIIGYTHAEFLSESEIARVLLWTEATYGKDTPVFFFDLSHGKRMRPNKHRNVFRLFYQCLLHSCRVGWTSRVLFVGVPNTGKSAIIGPLVRKLVKERRKAYVNYHIPRVGAEPGMTKGIYPYPFVREPKEIWLIDTPGLLPPTAAFAIDPELYFKLRVNGQMDDAPDGDSVRVADYVLWKCNRKEWFFYVDELKLDGPTDDIMEVLGKITNGDLGDKYKLAKAAWVFLELSHEHGFESMVLDDLELDDEDEKALEGRRAMNFQEGARVRATNWSSNCNVGRKASDYASRPRLRLNPVTQYMDYGPQTAPRALPARADPQQGAWVMQNVPAGTPVGDQASRSAPAEPGWAVPGGADGWPGAAPGASGAAGGVGPEPVGFGTGQMKRRGSAQEGPQWSGGSAGRGPALGAWGSLREQHWVGSWGQGDGAEGAARSGDRQWEGAAGPAAPAQMGTWGEAAEGSWGDGPVAKHRGQPDGRVAERRPVPASGGTRATAGVSSPETAADGRAGRPDGAGAGQRATQPRGGGARGDNGGRMAVDEAVEGPAVGQGQGAAPSRTRGWGPEPGPSEFGEARDDALSESFLDHLQASMAGAVSPTPWSARPSPAADPWAMGADDRDVPPPDLMSPEDVWTGGLAAPPPGHVSGALESPSPPEAETAVAAADRASSSPPSAAGPPQEGGFVRFPRAREAFPILEEGAAGLRALGQEGPVWTKKVPFTRERSIGMRNILQLLHNIKFGVILEVRDPRAPISSAHPYLGRIASRAKIHFIVYTRADLLSDAERDRVMRYTRGSVREYQEQRRSEHATSVFFVDTSQARHMPKKEREQNFEPLLEALAEACDATETHKILVTGLPNVGKSSLIVALTRELTIERRKKGAYHLPRIEDAAGVTLGSKQHCFHEKPNMFVIDTPGLLPPEDSFKDRELYWKLQALNLMEKMPAHSDVTLAEYALWQCNRNGLKFYVERFGLDGPVWDIRDVLERMGPDPNPDAEQEAALALEFMALCKAEGLDAVVLDPLPTYDDATAGPVPQHYPRRQYFIATDYVPGDFNDIPAVVLPKPKKRVPKKLR